MGLRNWIADGFKRIADKTSKNRQQEQFETNLKIKIGMRPGDAELLGIQGSFVEEIQRYPIQRTVALFTTPSQGGEEPNQKALRRAVFFTDLMGLRETAEYKAVRAYLKLKDGLRKQALKEMMELVLETDRGAKIRDKQVKLLLNKEALGLALDMEEETTKRDLEYLLRVVNSRRVPGMTEAFRLVCIERLSRRIQATAG
jgi:hypothetical protein